MKPFRTFILGAVLLAFLAGCRRDEISEPPFVPQCFVNFDDVSPSEKAQIEEAFREGTFVAPNLKRTDANVKELTTITEIIHEKYIINNIPTEQLPFLEPGRRVTNYTIYNLPKSMVVNDGNERCFPETTGDCGGQYIMDVAQDTPHVFRYYFCYSYEQLRLVSVGRLPLTPE